MERKTYVVRAWLVLLVFLGVQSAFLWPADKQAQPPPAPVLKDIPVPVIHVKGSHYEAGFQIGTQFKDDILREVAEMKKNPDWQKVRAEADRNGITSSIVRYNRGTRLLKKNLGRITVDKMKEFLSDHVNHPGSICRHGKGVKTTFSVIINLTTQTMLLARGNPCEVKYREYNFFAKK